MSLLNRFSDCPFFTMTYEELAASVKLLNADEAIEKINGYIEEHPGNADAYVLRGMKQFGAGRRDLAINDYLRALELDPDSSRARAALDTANSILDFYNKDLFNP